MQQVILAAIGVIAVGVLVYLSWVLLKEDDAA